MRMKNVIAFTAVLTAITAMAVPFSANAEGTYTDLRAAVSKDSMSFDKYLVMDVNANVPNVSFDFSIEKYNSTQEENAVMKEASDGNLAVINGVTAQLDFEDSTVTFAQGEETVKEVSDNAADDVWQDDTLGNEKYVKKKLTLDFSKVQFTEPGVYRYLITETGTHQGVTNDIDVPDAENATFRTLDVYVEDYKDYYDTLTDKTGYAEPDGKQLFIANYVLYEGKQDTAPSASAETADGKSTGYTNAYASYDLTFSKTVTGNQGSKDKYFAFTLEISNAVEGTVYDVSYAADDDEFTKDGNADVKISANPNHATTCIATDVEQPASLKVEENGTVKQVFYLQHGQSIAVRGLAEGTKYTITEEAEDYTPTVDVNNEKAIVSGTVVSSDTAGINADTIVQYTNDRSGVIPTGVLSTVAGSAGLVAVGILGIAGGALYLKKKKSEEA